MIEGAGKAIYDVISAWEFVSASPYDYQKTILCFDEREFCHIYDDSRVDFLPSKFDVGVSILYSETFSIVDGTMWFRYPIDKPENVQSIIYTLLRSYDGPCYQKGIRPTAYPFGIDKEFRFPGYVPEDRAVFLEILQEKFPNLEVIQFKLINQNPNLNGISLEPWGSGGDFPFGSTFECIMSGSSSLDSLRIPEAVVCSPDQTEFPEAEDLGLWGIHRHSNGETLELFPHFLAICLFQEDGSAAMESGF